MAKKGKTPSLISGNAGACKIVTASRRRTCKRCDGSIPGGCDCVEVNVPSSVGGYKGYCVDCFREILDQTQRDLDNLVIRVEDLA